MAFSVGSDLVHIPGFAAQLDVPGTRFADVFSAQELRTANTRESSRRAEHLAGRWAVKEAFIKAWSQALYGQPPVLVDAPTLWSSIDVRPDAWGRIAVVPGGEIAAALTQSLGRWAASASISHDGDYAMATVIVEFSR